MAKNYFRLRNPLLRQLLAVLLGLAVAPFPQGWANAQLPATSADTTDDAEENEVKDTRPDLPVSQKWKMLQKNAMWVDLKSKTKSVIVSGEVCHREGPLEMFACPRDTKEYESVVVVNAKAASVHAALLAVGAKPGSPVKFTPAYETAKGPVIDVFVDWLDENGKVKTLRGQQMVKHMPTGKAMKHDWIFSGSMFHVSKDTGKRYYLAEGGELICVSNFSTATMDIPIKSSQGNSELIFGAFTENIPPLATKIHLRLVPRAGKKSKSEKKPTSPKPDAKETDGAQE